MAILRRGLASVALLSTAMLLAIGLIATLTAGSSAHQAAHHKAAHHHPGGGGGGTISSIPWGTVSGQPVSLYTLTNGRMSVYITNYGAIVQSIWVPDRWGKLRNVALGFPQLQDYVNDFTQGFTGVNWPIPGASGSGWRDTRARC